MIGEYDAMTSWDDLLAAVPDLAGQVKAVFDRHRHKTMATLRQDGSPRISATETQFSHGELWLGSMPNALKARDLLRDPRVAIHSASADPDEMERESAGDAKIAGRAVEVTDPAVIAEVVEGAPPGPLHLFRLDVTEIVLTRVELPDLLVVDFWTRSGGRQTVKRK
jgi:hypothetical protein